MDENIVLRAEALTLTELFLASSGRMIEEPAPLLPLEQPIKDFKFPFELPGDVKEFLATEFLIDNLAPASGLMAIYGGPGSGKTFCAVDVAAHIALGLPYFGREVVQGGAVYVAAEAGEGLRKRIAAWRRAHGVGDFPLALIKASPDLGTIGGDTARLIEEIKAQQPRLGAPVRVIFLDTLARVMAGVDENSSSGMGAFVASASAIGTALDCLVVAVHHTGKKESLGLRGHSSLHGATDCEWHVKQNDDRLRIVTLEKLKESDDRLIWSFRLRKETVFDPAWVTNPEDLVRLPKRPVVSCVVEPVDMPTAEAPSEEPRALRGADAVVLEAVQLAIDEHGEAAPNDNHSAEAIGVSRRHVQDAAAQLGIGADSEVKSRLAMINRSLASLNAKGLIAVRQDWIFLP